MISIGWRNLRREPLRACVAIFGVVFAVTLVIVEVGMLLGLVRNASLLIDASRADLIVSKIDVRTFDFGTPFSERKKYRVAAVPGVERVEELNASVSVWKLPSGGNANCQVIGFDERGTLAPKLDLIAGSLEDLHNQDSIIIDIDDRPKLGNPNIGDTVELIQTRARVVGFTRNMHSFTTMPFIFTSLQRSDAYGWISVMKSLKSVGSESQSVYFLVKVASGANVEEVRRSILASVPGIDVRTREQFSWDTRRYWLIETGVGIGFLAAALLGMMVGGVIVSQTLYAMTMEKLPEFGVLKAMGANMTDLARVVLEQGLVCGAAGLSLGMLISYGVSVAASAAGTSVEIPVWLLFTVAMLTVALCSGAALVSILRLKKLEPALVFRT